MDMPLEKKRVNLININERRIQDSLCVLGREGGGASLIHFYVNPSLHISIRLIVFRLVLLFKTTNRLK